MNVQIDMTAYGADDDDVRIQEEHSSDTLVILNDLQLSISQNQCELLFNNLGKWIYGEDWNPPVIELDENDNIRILDPPATCG